MMKTQVSFFCNINEITRHNMHAHTHTITHTHLHVLVHIETLLLNLYINCYDYYLNSI